MRSGQLNILHLYGHKVYLYRFYEGWPAAAINYSAITTGVEISKLRAKYSGVILGGLGEVNDRKLTSVDLKRQWSDARKAGGES